MTANNLKSRYNHIIIRQPYADNTMDSWFDDEIKKLFKDGFILINSIEKKAVGIALEYKLLTRITDSLNKQKLKSGEHYIVL